MATTVGVKLDEATRERLQKLGELRDRSPHWLMKRAIERYLDAEEQYEREKAEDLARWERYVLTGEAISNADMDAFFDTLVAEAEGRAKTTP